MSRRRTPRWLKLTGLALVFTALAVWSLNQFLVGRVLDSYQGVPVRSNGFLFFQGHGRHYATDGYYYGQRWQCTEFIKRFFHDAKGHRMPDVWGHARTFFDPEVSQGGLNPRRGLVQFRNGGAEPPRPDDLLVFTDTTYGHVAIVTAVRSDAVEVIQQNVVGRTRQAFVLKTSGGSYSIASPRQPAGWLRLPATSKQP